MLPGPPKLHTQHPRIAWFVFICGFLFHSHCVSEGSKIASYPSPPTCPPGGAATAVTNAKTLSGGEKSFTTRVSSPPHWGLRGKAFCGVAKCIGVLVWWFSLHLGYICTNWFADASCAFFLFLSCFPISIIGRGHGDNPQTPRGDGGFSPFFLVVSKANPPFL